MKLTRKDLAPLLFTVRSWLSEDSNITGLDVGPKQKQGKETGELSIIVHVIKKKKKDELTDKHLLVPATVELHISDAEKGIQVLQVPTDVIECGELKFQANNQYLRPCPGGMQILPKDYGKSATLGANIIWGGRLRLISNNHSISINGKLGKPMLFQPDTSRPEYALVPTTDYIPVFTYPNRNYPLPFQNSFDFAFADITPQLGALNIYGLGPVAGVRAPQLGETIRMVGAETGKVVQGYIQSLTAVKVGLWANGEWAWFHNLIRLNAFITADGDSGAVFVGSDGKIVGMNIGGDGAYTYGTPIPDYPEE